MRDNLTTYKIWAPDNALWTDWAKPVLFAGFRYPDTPYDKNKDEIQTAYRVTETDKNTMVIIDLPGREGVDEALSLAINAGYRPVPLYNGVDTPDNYSMIVDVRDLVKTLFAASDILSSLNLKNDAPPAFMLDSERMKGAGKEPGKYDNRWCIFPQDMPSASFLLNHGIKKIIVRTSEIQTDLSHILCRYQEKGIKIHICTNTGRTIETPILKPSSFKSLIYRFKVISGLTRNSAGGFGGKIPEPQEGSRGYYGVG